MYITVHSAAHSCGSWLELYERLPESKFRLRTKIILVVMVSGFSSSKSHLHSCKCHHAYGFNSLAGLGREADGTFAVLSTRT
jgi:hypothetical protein